jgi:hypothetical protein
MTDWKFKDLGIGGIKMLALTGYVDEQSLHIVNFLYELLQRINELEKQVECLTNANAQSDSA